MQTPRTGRPLSIHAFFTTTLLLAATNPCVCAGEGHCEARPISSFLKSKATPSLIQRRSSVEQGLLADNDATGLGHQRAAQTGTQAHGGKPKEFSPATVLVTGAAGYLGSHAVLTLLGSGYHVIGVDDFSSSDPYMAVRLHNQVKRFQERNGAASFVFYQADIGKDDVLEKILKKEKPAVVMHFAGVPYAGDADPHRYDNNTVYAHKVSEAMANAGVKLLVHSSSCAVYGWPTKVPVTEETPEAPVSVYGRSKLKAETILKDWERRENKHMKNHKGNPAKLVIMRHFNVFGSDPYFRVGDKRPIAPDPSSTTYSGRLTTLLFAITQGTLPNFAVHTANYSTKDGTPIRDFVDVMDLVDAHLAVLPSLLTDRESPPLRIYNVGAGTPLSLGEVVWMTRAVTGSKYSIEYGDDEPSDPPELWADPGKLRREVGWEPRYTDLWSSLHRSWIFIKRSSTVRDKLAAIEEAKQAIHLKSVEITDESGFSNTGPLPARNITKLSEVSVLREQSLADTSTRGGSGPHANKHKNAGVLQDAEPKESSLSRSTMMAEMDLVIPTLYGLDFLEDWREFVEGMHVIVVQDGDPDKQIKIPDWVDYELYNRRDINQTLGRDAWIISSQDPSIRAFGFLASKKPYILTLDDDVYPCRLYQGSKIDAPWVHYTNLRTNATPVFLNSYFDPFSIRIGVPAAISHGLWLNSADHETPKQIVRPPATLTVPKGAIYSMFGRNMAFNRYTIGPTLMFGLMGDGQPWGRRADIWAGWASKVCIDLLGLSVKSGSPYVNHSKASSSSHKDYEDKDLVWQEKISYFFQKLRLSDEAKQGPLECYAELAGQVRMELGGQHPYFSRLADAMEVWIALWQSAAAGRLEFKPNRTSPGKGKAAASAPTSQQSVVDGSESLGLLDKEDDGEEAKPWLRCYSNIKLVISSHMNNNKVLEKLFDSLSNASFTSLEDVVVFQGGASRDSASWTDKNGVTWVHEALDSDYFPALSGLHRLRHDLHVCARFAYLHVLDSVAFDKTFPARFAALVGIGTREIRMAPRPNSNVVAFGRGVVPAYGHNFDNLTRAEAVQAEFGMLREPVKPLEIFGERVDVLGEKTQDERVDLHQGGHSGHRIRQPRFGLFSYPYTG